MSLQVEGISTVGLNLEELKTKIAGKRGTKVELRLRRHDDDETNLKVGFRVMRYFLEDTSYGTAAAGKGLVTTKYTPSGAYLHKEVCLEDESHGAAVVQTAR